MPKRIQRKRTKGWKMPAGAVYVGRGSKWGNPYTIAEAREAGYTGTDAELRRWVCHLFRQAVLHRNGMYADAAPTMHQVEELRGKDLACWCPLDRLCHADVLLELANRN